MILLDTSVLSRVFRRRKPAPAEDRFRAVVEGLLRADRPLGLPSIVLQELLSGLRSEKDFETLREHLQSAFSIVHATVADHIEAARIRNACIAKGANASGVDCVIAAVSIAGAHELFAVDGDFTVIAKHSALRLFEEES